MFDIVHLAWPERWSGVDPAVNARVIEQVRAAGARIAWTQHNLVPHRHKDEAGFATYALWAEAATWSSTTVNTDERSRWRRTPTVGRPSTSSFRTGLGVSTTRNIGL